MPDRTDDSRLAAIPLSIIGAFVIFPMLFMIFGVVGFEPMIGGLWGGGMSGDGPIPGWLFIVDTAMQIPFLVAIIGGSYLIYGAIARSESEPYHPLEELRLADARSELPDEEYERRREALERDTEPGQNGAET